MKKVQRIIINSSNGYFDRMPYEDEIVVKGDSISYKLQYSYENPFFEREERKQALNKRWKHKLSLPEKVLVEAIFDFATTFKDDAQDIMVLDGEGIKITIEFDDGEKYEAFNTYGDYIGPEYGNIFKMIQLVSYLVPKNKYRPDYFKYKDPFIYRCKHMED